MRPRPAFSFVSAFAAAVALFLVACDRPPSADSLPVWSKEDHHSNDDDKAAQGAAGQVPARQGPQAGQAGQAGQPGQAGQAGQASDVAQLVEITWRQQCSSCHGPMGRGDGQMGPMVQAPDLSRADWQSQVSDAEMAAIIKNGRNRMPRFDLPDPVLAGLVARIRGIASR
jgi:mono/diheme cytochrome c family protein